MSCINNHLNSITASFGFDLENPIANQPTVITGGGKKNKKKKTKTKKKTKKQKRR